MRQLHFKDPQLWSYRQSPCPPLTPARTVLDTIASIDLDSPSSSQWSQCTQMPSEIHVELLARGVIPDPFKGRAEETAQWVGESDWIYRSSFAPGAAMEVEELVFEGLDTFATVFLNDVQILEVDNMFLPHRVNVTKSIQAGENTLVLVFASAFIKGRKLEEEYLGEGKHNFAWNGDPSRLFVRKSAFNYGWDWGPKLMTVGPWKPIRLESYQNRIVELDPRVTVDSSLQASLTVTLTASSPVDVLSANVTLVSPSGIAIRKVSIDLHDTGSVSWRFETDEIELWWSVGLGGQPLYLIKVDLLSPEGHILDSSAKRIGFRRLRVVQDALLDQEGTSFYFEVNNVPIFAGGSNWIPIDSFLTNATKERYRSWLELLVRGNQNMIRVWGGGIYESDDLYDLCDEMGILAWQDFCFACGQYPLHPQFLRSVESEAEANVIRLRHHPSLSIFAGNNEDYQVAEDEGLEYDRDDHDGDWAKTNFPARELYERVLPAIVHRLSSTFYHPGSPWGGKTSRDPTVGDIHQWNVWHGTQEPYQSFDKLGGRFVSEFGMQGFPDLKTVEYWLDGDEGETYPQSRTNVHHNKATGSERRLELYLIENVRHTFDLPSYIYATQLIQSEAIGTAYRAWRRQFQGPGQEYTAGALVWQLNDVWPCTSWSIVDYFLRPKLAYYAIKRALQPFAVGMKRSIRRTYPDRYSTATFVDITILEVWTTNSTLAPRQLRVLIEGHDLGSGALVWSKTVKTTLESNRSQDLEEVVFDGSEDFSIQSTVFSARLYDGSDVLSRITGFPEPYKFLSFPSTHDTALTVTIDLVQERLVIQARRPIKGLVFSFSQDIDSMDDNGLDLIPREERVVGVTGMTDPTVVSWRYLGDRDAD